MMTSMPGAPTIIDARVRLPMDRRPPNARTKPTEYTDRYDDVFDMADARRRSLHDLVADMDQAGIARAVMHAEYEYGDHADDLNEAVAKVVADHTDRFWGFGTVSLAPLRPMRTMQQAERAADMGLLGLNIQPAFFDLAIDDRRLYPLYGKAAELGLVVAIHTGVNYSLVNPIEVERPVLLDHVACDFPQLRLIACHGGWPWIPEMVAVARRHKNVYIDFGGMSPKYVGQQGTGWEMMRRFMDSLLVDQVLFATDWPVFSMTRAVGEWQDMGLRVDTLEALLSRNMLTVLKAAVVGPEGGTDG